MNRTPQPVSSGTPGMTRISLSSLTAIAFTSNMFGPSYIFGVEVAKAVNPSTADVQSTPDLARKFNPAEPTPTTTEK
jgi:hypothetical protein